MSSTVTLTTDSVIFDMVIGNGASSKVFRALDKRTGEYRAAKVIKDKSKYNQLDLNREIKTLKNLKHPNIVQLFGKETENDSGLDVLILGYCQTSLYSFLQEPENSHGLRDQEFLILFCDVASGLQYLHSNGIIHRDLKPGNILRNVKPDLSPIYIISDFGTSRKLEHPEEEYFSLVGTEEFLHPNVYQKAFIDKKQSTPFNSGTDLWSLGCTLFQAISSRMPFIPFDGARNDRRNMFKMLANKPSGCIYAYQSSPGGDPIWENRFPEHCPMSSNLQELMRGILSALMEADSRKQITYENLFRFKERLSAMFRLEVHLTSDGTTHTLYLDPAKSYAELQELIAQYTDIPAGRQLLFYNDQILDNLIQKDFKLNELLNKPPLINSLTLVSKNEDQRLSPYIIDPSPVYHNTNTINKDYDVTSKRCQIVNNIMLLVLQSLSFQQSISKTISAMWTMLKTMFLKVEKNHECLKEVRDQITFQIKHQHMLKNGKRSRLLSDLFSKKHQRRKKEDEELTELAEKMQSKFKPVSDCVIDLNKNCQIYLQNSQQPTDNCTSDCVKKIAMYQNKMKEILGRVKKRKGREILIDVENIKHLHDRSESEEVCASSLALWQDHCWIQKRESFQRFEYFKRIFFESKEKATNVNKLMTELRRVCNAVRHACTKMYQDLSLTLTKFDYPLFISRDRSELLDPDDDQMEDDGSPKLEPKTGLSHTSYYYHRHGIDPYTDNDDCLPSKDKRLARSKSLTAQDNRYIASRAREKNAVSGQQINCDGVINGHGNCTTLHVLQKDYK